MSSPSSDDRTASRAEARRRARLAARGELPTEPEVDADEPQSKPNFFQRIFPPAPPLPNRPDPLAGFDRSGPLRPVRERLFLLRRNLLAWLVLGVIVAVSFIASESYGSSVLGLVGTFMLFGSLIAAGWFGWQRPTLFGTATGVAWLRPRKCFHRRLVRVARCPARMHSVRRCNSRPGWALRPSTTPAWASWAAGTAAICGDGRPS